MLIRLWSTLSSSGLLQIDKRKEVVAESLCSPPAHQLPDKLCRPTPRSAGETVESEEDTAFRKLHEESNTVSGPNDATSHASSSEQQHIADFHHSLVLAPC